MKISFWIPAIVLYVVRVAFSNSVQVGTVLFTTTDLVRKCWTENDKSLLKARFVMQDVLPDPDCIDFSNPEAVVILLNYFHTCFQIISTSTYGKIQNLMYMALSDALGGYLRAFVLPYAKRAYYAGQVKYSEAKKLFQLYEDIKVYLKTNGMGWAEPQKISCRKFHVMPLVVTGGDLEACRELYIIEKEGKLHCINPNCDFKNEDSTDIEFRENSKESFREDVSEKFENPKRFQNSSFAAKLVRRNSTRRNRSANISEKKNNFLNISDSSRGRKKFLTNLTKVKLMNRTREGLELEGKPELRKSRCECGCGCECGSEPGSCSSSNSASSNYNTKRVIVPLPVLDDPEAPHSIAVPFKNNPLRNLKCRNSAFVLEYYYMAVIKCFIAKGNTRTDIKNFNSKFHYWLVTQVMPHLSEEQWYPGFGGVFRVMETIKKFGVENTANEPGLQDIAFMFGPRVEFEIDSDLQKKAKDKARDVNDVDGNLYPSRRVITAIILVSLIWVFVFCAIAFYCQATRGRNTLYEGYSDATSQSRPVPVTVTCEPKPKRLNFQFLVKFFRRTPELEGTLEKEIEEKEVTPMRKSKHGFIKHGGLKYCKGRSKRKTDCRQGHRSYVCGQGDFPAFRMPNLDKHFNPLLSTWPGQSGSSPFDIFKADYQSGDAPPVENPEKRDQVQMIWKKQSVKIKKSITKEGRNGKPFKEKHASTLSRTTSEDALGRTSTSTYSASVEDETKDGSTEKPSSTCCCSGSCQHSHSTSTNSSSRSQVEEKLSSATLEFFEEVISRHKPNKKGSTQESTEESESEGEGSSSSESDY